jgi:ERCC4-type nuclease
MLIRLDTRETLLENNIKRNIETVHEFSNITLVTEMLSLGDIIIEHDTTPVLIIERKTIADLFASIKDGRYEEQSYRLNNEPHHNHNIIYLIEGDVNKCTKSTADKLKFNSTLLSLSYYKGFSVFRTLSVDETALFICNCVNKIVRETAKNKIPYYHYTPFAVEPCNTDKGYISVVKSVKKNNITPDNICEIMLCQIPAISPIIATAIMKNFNTMNDLILKLHEEPNYLKTVTFTNSKNETKKINKTCIENIRIFLLKK